MQTTAIDSHWLDVRLPEPHPIEREDGLYGGFLVAARYAELGSVSSSPRGFWQHGWVPQHCQVCPGFLFGFELKSEHRKTRLWVARKDEALYLARAGFSNTRTVSLPIVYTKTLKVERKPGSLLVMPMHSLEYTEHSWNFEAYAESIDKLRQDFAEVVICIHPSCWKNGYWISEFERRKFKIIKGAWMGDAESLLRMRCLFESFEYMTTNGLGSHLPYAGYFGAKPSIFGPYADLQAKDFANDPFYQAHPDALEGVIHAHSLEVLTTLLPHLFVSHPSHASEARDWGSLELGADNKLSPKALRYEFGWSLPQRMVLGIENRLRGINAVRTMLRAVKRTFSNANTR